MDRLVRIMVKNTNVGAGFLISLDDDAEKDLILTVAHIFGEDEHDGNWNLWDVNPSDVQIYSEYYNEEFVVVDILYQKSDAAEEDIALIYIKKPDVSFEGNNFAIPYDSTRLLGKKVIVEGYGREEFNGTKRVIEGTVNSFVNVQKSMYRINYVESDRVGTIPSADINKGMSGGPVYFLHEGSNTRVFVGIQKMVPSTQSTDGILGVFSYEYCIELIKRLYGVDIPFENAAQKLINNDSLFKNIHMIRQKFNIVPNDIKHIGASIEYEDIQELRSEFIQELIYTIIDWSYDSEKYRELKEGLMRAGKTENAANMELNDRVRNQFRKETSDNYAARVRMCDLLLFHFIQRCMKASPLLRKENIYRNRREDIACAEVIHYKFKENKNNIILGRAMIAPSGYTFDKAFLVALEGILTAYTNHKKDISLYVHQDFSSNEMKEIAESYLNKEMKSIKVHLVNFIMYEETQALNITNDDSEEDIRKRIDLLIEDRYDKFENSKINIEGNPILGGITYIIFPTWKLDELVKVLSDSI